MSDSEFATEGWPKLRGGRRSGAEYQPGEAKRCSVCQVVKTQACFKKGRGTCRDCTAIYDREYSRRNAEVRRERARQWQKDNPEQHNENHRLASRRRYAQNPEANKVATQRWREENPDKIRALWNESNQRRQKAGTLDPELWQQILDRFNHRCCRCGVSDEKEPLCQDHIIPTVRGGLTTEDNIQVLCRICNSIKHTNTTDYRRSALIGFYRPRKPLLILKASR